MQIRGGNTTDGNKQRTDSRHTPRQQNTGPREQLHALVKWNGNRIQMQDRFQAALQAICDALNRSSEADDKQQNTGATSMPAQTKIRRGAATCPGVHSNTVDSDVGIQDGPATCTGAPLASSDKGQLEKLLKQYDLDEEMEELYKMAQLTKNGIQKESDLAYINSEFIEEIELNAISKAKLRRMNQAFAAQEAADMPTVGERKQEEPTTVSIIINVNQVNGNGNTIKISITTNATTHITTNTTTHASANCQCQHEYEYEY